MNRKLVQKIALVPGVLTLAALVIFQFGNYLFRGNLHTVIPGQIYRSAEPTPASLARWIESIALLLEGQGLDRASEQFSLKFGYPGSLLGSDLPGFLVSYRDWLASEELSHTAERFRSWVRTEYVAYYYEADLEFSSVPETLRAGEPFSLRISATNRSNQPIPMNCAPGQGVRLSLRLRSLEPGGGKLRELRFCNRAELLAPAATTVVTAGIYDLGAPGSYEFAADLVDEFEEHFFADMGSQISRHTITIH